MITTDTRCEYVGLKLRSPVIVGACPLTLNSESVRQLTLAGAGAVVLPSLFQEQVIEEGRFLEIHSEPLSPRVEHCQKENHYNGGLDNYLATITRLKRQTGIPVFASLNGCQPGAWLDVAGRLEDAGASGLEVCFEPQDVHPERSADQSEADLLTMVDRVCDMTSLPVAVKLAPFHSNLTNLVVRLESVGARAVVCFASEPAWHVSIDRIQTTPTWELHPAGAINQTIAGVARAAAAPSAISVAASGGVSSTEDCIKLLLAGADVVMITSEIYRSGPDAVAHMVEGLSAFLNRSQLNSLDELFAARPEPKLDRASVLDCMTESPI